MPINANARLKASALAYAILISLVLTLITLSIIMAFQLHQQRIASITNVQQSVKNAESGILLLLTDPTIGSIGLEELDLFGAGTDSVILERKIWGGYEVLHCLAKCGQQRINRIILAGSEIGDSIPSLVLADKGKPLSLCGKTRISGNCLLPKSGVKRAYIEGKNYVGRELIYGKQSQSPANIENISIPSFINHLTSSIDRIGFEDLSLLTMNRSFTDPTLLVTSVDEMNLEGVNWTGNILVQSKTEIQLGWNAKMRNCIIQAPKVIVESGFKGSVQIYADSIIIHDDAILEYPSGIYSIEGPKALVSIGENTTVIGQIFLQSNSNVTPMLKLGKGSRIYGIVVNQGQTELKGEVHGQVMTEGFILRTASATYENHLLDATIGSEGLPRPFVTYFQNGLRGMQIMNLE